MDPAVVARAHRGLYPLYKDCTLCPRSCRVDRLAGKIGFCRQTETLRISSANPHFGEESCLVGDRGSGTVFFSGCNLGCIYCQNYSISHMDEGQLVSPEQAAEIFLALQARGCHNLNLVTPTHFVPSILASLKIALKQGFSLPVVYNCGGYESVDVLKQLDGIISVYMPDVKYFDDAYAVRFSGAKGYVAAVKAALKEMHAQVGDLTLNGEGLAERGLLIRHLVLPDDLAGSEALARFLADQISTDTAINVMGQYQPCFRAFEYKELGRRPTAAELLRAREICRQHGLHRFL